MNWLRSGHVAAFKQAQSGLVAVVLLLNEALLCHVVLRFSVEAASIIDKKWYRKLQ